MPGDSPGLYWTGMSKTSATKPSACGICAKRSEGNVSGVKMIGHEGLAIAVMGIATIAFLICIVNILIKSAKIAKII